jgi:sugar/nucleoside kinase (ribokinase family)
MAVHPDYLVIGHITKDLYNGAYQIGGTATYSALTARSLGYHAGIVSSNGPDIDLSPLPSDVLVQLRPCAASTTFENIYHDGHRRQQIGARAALLRGSDVPDQWRSSPIVHFGPVAQEVDEAIAAYLSGALLGLTPQGWMRRWDEDGIVHPAPWEPSDALLARADALILSREDVGNEAARIERYAERARLLVLTAGWKGATVYYQGQVRAFAAPRVEEVDPTGAGDIFAAAFLVSLYECGEPFRAACFANCVAAHSVERRGMASIPTGREIARCRARWSLEPSERSVI